MALSKVTYTDNETVIGATNLNAIQDEIIANASAISEKVSTTDYNPDTATETMTQSVGKDSSGKLWTEPGLSTVEWGDIEGTLSQQTDLQTALNGKVSTGNYAPDTATSTMTQSVGKDSSGKLWTTPTTIVDNVTSTDTDKALSANMGKTLQEEITNLQGIGRFLAIWNCATGLPTTNPTTLPYTYKTGDYFRVGTVATGGCVHSITISGTTPASGGLLSEYDGKPFTVSFSFKNNVATQYTSLTDISLAIGSEQQIEATGNIDTTYAVYGIYTGVDESTSEQMIALLDSYPLGQKMAILTETTATISNITDTVTGTVGTTNYKPNGATYTGTASSTVETANVKVGWVYYYDGSQWVAQSSGDAVWGSITGTLASQTDLQTALDAKVNTSSYNPDSKTSSMTQSVGVDSDGKLWTDVGSGDVAWGDITGTLSDQTDLQDALDEKVDTSSYSPVAKTTAMTQSVGVDSDGALWTTPGAGTFTVPSVTIAASQIVSQNPITVQLTSEQKAVVEDMNTAALKFDLTALSYPITYAYKITYDDSDYISFRGLSWGATNHILTNSGEILFFYDGNNIIVSMNTCASTTTVTAKTSAMTQSVGIDSNGALWTAPGSGSSSWGTITGTLSNQTDLQTALDAKINASNFMLVNISDSGTEQYSADKTAYEIYTAHNNGKVVYGFASDGQYVLSSVYIENNIYTVEFTCPNNTDSDGFWQRTYTITGTQSANTSVTLSELALSQNEILSLYVYISEENGVYTSDELAYDIYTEDRIKTVAYITINDITYQLKWVSSSEDATNNTYTVVFSSSQSPNGTSLNNITVAIVGTETENTSVTVTQSSLSSLPAVTSADNGKVLMVVDGQWAVASLPTS